jgi:hypothetical protein
MGSLRAQIPSLDGRPHPGPVAARADLASWTAYTSTRSRCSS